MTVAQLAAVLDGLHEASVRPDTVLIDLDLLVVGTLVRVNKFFRRLIGRLGFPEGYVRDFGDTPVNQVRTDRPISHAGAVPMAVEFAVIAPPGSHSVESFSMSDVMGCWSTSIG